MIEYGGTLWMHFSIIKKGRNERSFDTMLLKLIRKWEKIFFNEFNISSVLILRKWKMALNDLTL